MNKIILLDRQVLKSEYKKNRLDEALAGEQPSKWLSIVYKGRMVEINSKGKIREKKKDKGNRRADRKSR